MKSILYIIGIAAAMLSGCSTTRYVEKGQFLLRRVQIKIDSTAHDTPLPSELISYIGQRPNRKLLGIFDWGLGIYNLNDIQSNGWLHRHLRQWGDPPVIFSPEEAEYSLSNLTTAMYNKGYLRASTSLALDTLSPRKIRARYNLRLGPRYRISRHEEMIRSAEIDSLLHPADTLQARQLFPNERYTSLLDSGCFLAPDMMQAERRRITQVLRNRGHWAFREEMIRFEIDTLGGIQDAWVRTIIDTVSQTYRIGRVRIQHALPEDTAYIRKKTVDGVEVSTSINHPLRSTMLAARNRIQPGALYSQDATSRTYSLLADLGAVRSIAIAYREDSTAVVPTLDVDITTTAEQAMELVADAVGTHSGGNLGANVSLAFMHNNIFHGSEQLKLTGRIGYEELSGLSSNHLNYGIEAALRFPSLALPFYSARKQKPIKATTMLTLGYDYQTRPEFKRNLLSASWRYSWSHYHKPAFRYTFNLVEVDYTHFGYMNTEFLSTLPAYTRMLSYRDQFIVGMSFTMNYNSGADYRLAALPWRHNLRLHIQSAGNTLYGLSTLMRAQRDAYGSYSFMNINYAQFVRGEIDYSGQYRLSGKNALAYHAAVSAVLPYANSQYLPIDQRYFSGGSTSVRGWSVRSLGPGSMPNNSGTSIFQQVGDIKLDLSLELRLRLLRSWELAAFVDAGNVWTIHRYENQPSGDFDPKRFYREIALSTGLGVRWDFDYFLLRLDAGLKMYDPQRPLGERWVMGRLPLKQAIALHFALGYPF